VKKCYKFFLKNPKKNNNYVGGGPTPGGEPRGGGGGGGGVCHGVASGFCGELDNYEKMNKNCI